MCLKSQNSDCHSKLLLKDTIHHSKPITGFGTEKEFEGNDLTDNKHLENENHSAWYLIKVPTTGFFTFDIIAETENDDWDFLLYKNELHFCEKIKNKTIQPIRSNLSRSPSTGLSLKAAQRYVAAGVHNNYSKAMAVKKGEELVLVVNNAKKAGSKHTLILHFPVKKITKKMIAKEVGKTIEKKRVKNTTLFQLTTKDAASKKLINGHLTIYGLDSPFVKLDGVSEYAASISKKNRKITIECCAKGYMLVSEEHKVSTNAEFLTEILLEKIDIGKKVNLSQVQFYGNQFNLLPSANPSLKTLVLFMKSNPSLKIEVGGHVNGPGERNLKKYKELSYNRANAVKEYLIEHGVAATRILQKGYGNTQMLYPHPKNPDQASFNRRVEITIVAL